MTDRRSELRRQKDLITRVAVEGAGLDRPPVEGVDVLGVEVEHDGSAPEGLRRVADGRLEVPDLLAVLDAWGPCE